MWSSDGEWELREGWRGRGGRERDRRGEGARGMEGTVH